MHKIKKEVLTMKVQLATGIYSEKKDTKDVVISNIRREVSQKGVRMYVMDCDIVLARTKRSLTAECFIKLGNRNPDE